MKPIHVLRRARQASVSLPLSATGTPATAQWGVAYSDTAVTASGGTAPYNVSGLPSGLSGSFVGGALTISGTPE